MQFYQCLQFGFLPIPIPKAKRISEVKAAVDEEWNKTKILSGWPESKARHKQRLSRRHKKNATQFIFATLMVLCQLKHSDLDKKFRVCRVTW